MADDSGGDGIDWSVIMLILVLVIAIALGCLLIVLSHSRNDSRPKYRLGEEVAEDKQVPVFGNEIDPGQQSKGQLFVIKNNVPSKLPPYVPIQHDPITEFPKMGYAADMGGGGFLRVR